jgi:L-threonylcarbamoyladenylate synthase
MMDATNLAADTTKAAARIVLEGGAIVYPTETVYGIGVNALEERSIEKAFEIKGRPQKMPISIAVSSFEMIEDVATLSDEEWLLAEKLLPGPVTILVQKGASVPDLLTSGSKLVGIRFPDHEMALEIIEASGPITSTSANKTGGRSPCSVEELDLEIASSVDLVVDGGRCRYCEPSTLVDLRARKVIRQGAALDLVLKAIS